MLKIKVSLHEHKIPKNLYIWSALLTHSAIEFNVLAALNDLLNFLQLLCSVP